MMKQKWQQLQPREQQLVLISAILLVVFISYSLIWQPLNANILKAEQKLARQQQLLTWVMEQGQTLQAGASAPQASGSLTSIVNSTARQAGIKVSRMQPKGDSLQLWLDDIAFDQLLAWLLQLKQNYQLNIEAIDITNTDTQGVVAVRRLQLAK